MQDVVPKELHALAVQQPRWPSRLEQHVPDRIAKDGTLVEHHGLVGVRKEPVRE